MLGDGDGQAGVEVGASDLLEVQRPQHTPEDDVEELDAAGIVHHVGQRDGDGDGGAVSLTSAGPSNTLAGERERERGTI